jgi:hypothetical protein
MAPQAGFELKTSHQFDAKILVTTNRNGLTTLQTEKNYKKLKNRCFLCSPEQKRSSECPAIAGV